LCKGHCQLLFRSPPHVVILRCEHQPPGKGIGVPGDVTAQSIRTCSSHEVSERPTRRSNHTYFVMEVMKGRDSVGTRREGDESTRCSGRGSPKESESGKGLSCSHWNGEGIRTARGLVCKGGMHQLRQELSSSIGKENPSRGRQSRNLPADP